MGLEQIEYIFHNNVIQFLTTVDTRISNLFKFSELNLLFLSIISGQRCF